MGTARDASPHAIESTSALIQVRTDPFSPFALNEVQLPAPSIGKMLLEIRIGKTKQLRSNAITDPARAPQPRLKAHDQLGYAWGCKLVESSHVVARRRGTSRR